MMMRASLYQPPGVCTDTRPVMGQAATLCFFLMFAIHPARAKDRERDRTDCLLVEGESSQKSCLLFCLSAVFLFSAFIDSLFVFFFFLFFSASLF